MISGAGLCWQHVGGVGSTTTTTTTTSVRQNTNNSIFLLRNQKSPQNSHQCDNKYICLYI